MSIFLSDDPIVITSPVRIGPTDADVPPLTLTTNPKSDGTTVDPIAIVTGGSIVPTIPQPADQTPFAPSTGGGGNSFLGVVGGQVGGAVYSCTLTGSTGVPFAANVTMQNLDPTAVLPSGVAVMVVSVGVGAGAVFRGFPCVYLPFQP